ncbi:expressed unknown protein [Seminavis robusta]|uniref:Methyltransferase domain-containing protein n=1 Tax=Seminavis robusta TaxID=568900 RepID=A0A9N8DFK5_9STRA|nr:expressed unknown protein [Seminavis robusta]|eukprot:Sro95_g049210.1 n/a (412) ;mRNA; r:30129-31497
MTSPGNTDAINSTCSKSASSTIMTDDEFESWMLAEFVKPHGNASLYQEYREIFHLAASAVRKWRQRFHGDPSVWKRLFDKDRVTKEFIEAIPIIQAVFTFFASNDNDSNDNDTASYTVVDLASGKGYLSMLLAELLPPSKVQRFVLMDKAWPTYDQEPQKHHMSKAHIAGDYQDKWPIPLVTSKQDFKKSRQRTLLQDRFFSQGPVILLAVHLCGTLSLKAVDFFNHNTNIVFFALKPCCLPGIIHAKRKEVFQFRHTCTKDNATDSTEPLRCYHSFEAATVCMHGKWNKNVWKGPHRSTLTAYFETWADNLYLGIATEQHDTDTIDTPNQRKDTDDNPPNKPKYRTQTGTMAHKLQKTVAVQTEGGYQNEFLFAQRCPVTPSVWEQLLLQDEEASRLSIVNEDEEEAKIK